MLLTMKLRFDLSYKITGMVVLPCKIRNTRFMSLLSVSVARCSVAFAQISILLRSSMVSSRTNLLENNKEANAMATAKATKPYLIH